MSAQPEALRLAEFCDGNAIYAPAAAELRRLHAVNAELLELLEVLQAAMQAMRQATCGVPRCDWMKAASAAIARATGAAS